jgi:SH3-like domain-containing protein
MIVRALVVLCFAVVAMPVAAQMSPPPGTLKVPPKGQSTTPGPPPAPPVAAPRTAVEQVAPYSTPRPATAAPAASTLGHSAPGKPTPVVQPPGNTHAQKPPPAKHPAPSATAASAAPKPEAPPPVASAPEPAKPAEPGKGSVTGMPLPRWASLRSDEVNLRAGPGTRYPVDWVYRRHDLPVEIEREFEVWRLIRDQDGVRGWVHAATLTGRRSFVVEGADRLLRGSPSDDAQPVALLKPGVVGRIRACELEKHWCEMQVGDFRGWLKRDEVWGIYPNEAVN